MSAKKVGDQIYRKRPLDSNLAPTAYTRAEWEDLTDAEKEQIRAQEEQENEEDEDDD